MDNKLRARFDKPEHGWVGLTISYGDLVIEIIGSYMPTNSFESLSDALHTLLLYEGSASSIWYEEAPEIELLFSRFGEIVNLKIIQYPDYRRGIKQGEVHLEISASYDDICIPFWRALRDLQDRFTHEELESGWHRTFPSIEINNLTDAIKESKRITL